VAELPKSIVFVASTDPRAGKTIVSGALVRRLRALGHRSIAMKPIETGCRYGDDHDLIGPDGALLHEAAHRSAPPLVISPYRLAQELDPAPALERAGIELSLEDLVNSVEAARSFGDIAVVEGAGGALAPLTQDALGLDLAERLRATLLIAAPDRPSVTSRVLLVLEAARRRAINLAGVVLSRLSLDDGTGSENARWIKERGGVRVLTTVPFVEGEDKARILAVEEHFAAQGVAEAILDAVRRP
jgi:dethiobiotin synthase